MKKITSEIGKAIRRIRLEKGMTVKQLAQSTNLSASLISQVERGLITPSIPTLVKVSNAVGVPLVSFFLGTEKNPVIQKHQRKKLFLSSAGVAFELLSPIESRKIEFLLIEIEGKDGDYELVSYSGEKCGYVIEGKMKVILGERDYYLNQGDSIYFESTIPHRFKSADGKRSVSIWAITPPSF
ncbi:helix-turn-helix domain-containing protein [Candidatus Aerophobetes bacterium]|nr:helix-turn-helix domain-containing protein [Candidatus Aerophobetes bacterium]